MKRSLLLLVVLCFAIGANSQTTYTLDSTVLTARVVKDSMDIPWEIIWGPDDHIWATERFGRVSRINPETGEHQVLLDMSAQVYERSETGMLGMVLHPDFTKNPHVFIAYTYLDGFRVKERLVRFDYGNDTLMPADTLIEDITGNTTHVGCRLLILPDMTMLMTTGDAQNQTLPLNRSSVVGKTLRINLDGSIPVDNPDPQSLVWSYGHRNAQGIWRAPNGIIYSSEHGPTTDDELNILMADSNYGWPQVHGFCDSPPEQAYCNANDVVEPLVVWTPTIAPSDIIWYDHPSIPEFKEKLLMTVLKDKSLIAFGFSPDGKKVVSQNKYFKNQLKRLRDICVSPKGDIYLATSGDRWANDNPFTHTIVELSNKSWVGVSEIDPSAAIQTGSNRLQIGEPFSVTIINGEKGEFALFDVYGRNVLSSKLNSKNFVHLNTKTGIYFWRVQLENGAVKKGKLVVY